MMSLINYVGSHDHVTCLKTFVTLWMEASHSK